MKQGLNKQEQEQPSKQSSIIALTWIGLIAMILLMPFVIDGPFSPVFDSWPLAVVLISTLLLLYFRPPWLQVTRLDTGRRLTVPSDDIGCFNRLKTTDNVSLDKPEK
jgi:hypothetical protein